MTVAGIRPRRPSACRRACLRPGGAVKVLLVVALWLVLIGAAPPPATAHDEHDEPDLAPGWVLVKLRDPSRPLPVQTAQALYGALDIEPMTRLGLQPGGTVRAGFVHYNTLDEVDRLLAQL